MLEHWQSGQTSTIRTPLLPAPRPPPCSLPPAPRSLAISDLPSPISPPGSLLPAPCSLLPAPCSLLPAPRSPLPAPRSPHAWPPLGFAVRIDFALLVFSSLKRPDLGAAMPPSAMPLVSLSEMVADQEADLFVLMTLKEQLTTRDGKPYFKVGFRDARREVTFPIWGNSPFAIDCRDHWTPGKFYKLRAVYRESTYGPQLDIRKIREVVSADQEDGFDPAMCCASSRFDGETMFAELTEIAETRIPAGRTARSRAPAAAKTSGTAARCLRRPPSSPRLCRRAVGTCAQRHPQRGLPCRSLCRLLCRHDPAVGQGIGRRRGNSARHRQGPRTGLGPRGSRIHRPPASSSGTSSWGATWFARQQARSKSIPTNSSVWNT